jgi:hypothetical protein
MLYKALIMSVMTYAYTTWEYAADAHLLKLQHLQNRVLHTIGNLDKCTLVHELHVAFRIPYVYNCITKLCRTVRNKPEPCKSKFLWYWTRRSHE